MPIHEGHEAATKNSDAKLPNFILFGDFVQSFNC